MPSFTVITLTGLPLLVCLLVFSLGTVHLYLSIEEVFDYDRQRIPPRFSYEERQALYFVLCMAALGGASATGIMAIMLRML